jgi:hypothetical protein
MWQREAVARVLNMNYLEADDAQIFDSIFPLDENALLTTVSMRGLNWSCNIMVQ